MVKVKKPKIGIIGVGMVGGPIKRYFEETQSYKRGQDFFCYDIDSKKGFFDNVNQADIIFVCVPTPNDANGNYNLSIVESALKMIKPEGKIVVIKSTVSPGSVEYFQKQFPKHKIVFNPEFLTESQAWLDFIRPDRQVIGHTKKSIDVSMLVLSLLPQAPFMAPWGSDCYTTNRVSATEAEMAKIAANVFGATKVVFGNILADLSLAVKNYLNKKGIKADVSYENVRKIISADHRIGGSWLNVNHGSYCGFGGYCFPKDFKAFIGFFDELIAVLSKDKKNNEIVFCLEKGRKVFQAIWDYNEALLKVQNLSVADVSQHNKDIILEKRKNIREEKQ